MVKESPVGQWERVRCLRPWRPGNKTVEAVGPVGAETASIREYISDGLCQMVIEVFIDVYLIGVVKGFQW